MLIMDRFEAESMALDAVVQQVRRWDPPARVRLSIRPADLESFTWPCDFCGEPVILSAGGGGLTLDARSAGAPGSSTLTSHRACLAGRLHPGSAERARILGPGMADGIQPA